MKIRFIQDCTVYPEGKQIDARVGQTLDIADEAYAQLLVDKGHAVAADKAATPKKKGAEE